MACKFVHLNLGAYKFDGQQTKTSVMPIPVMREGEWLW